MEKNYRDAKRIWKKWLYRAKCANGSKLVVFAKSVILDVRFQTLADLVCIAKLYPRPDFLSILGDLRPKSTEIRAIWTRSARLREPFLVALHGQVRVRDAVWNSGPGKVVVSGRIVGPFQVGRMGLDGPTGPGTFARISGKSVFEPELPR